VKLYIGGACGLVEQLGHCEDLYWVCVWFGGTGRTL